MCGHALGPAGGERERRNVSVVFVDLMGFSTITHGLDPEELRDLADEVLTVVAGVVEDFDGYVDAFRGDGLIAVFGAPHSHPDDPYRAVVVAAASLRAIERVGSSRALDLRGRAGVASGMVIAGSVGSGRVREYTVMGSTVNLASRLESAAGPGEVWVSEETFEASRHRLDFARIDGVTLPGFPASTKVYRFLTDREYERDRYASLPFIGRAKEMAALEGLVDAVREQKRARHVWLVGEAGSGKTRLLRELERRIDPAATSMLWLTSNATARFRWTDLAEQLFGTSSDGDEWSQRVRVQEVLDRLLPGEARWHRLVLGSLALAPNVTWNRLERRAIDRTMLAWRDLLAASLRRSEGPGAMVVAIECERSEASLEQFVQLLASSDAPFLIVRPSRGRDLPEGTERITLEPLNGSESQALVDLVTDPVFRVAAHSLVQQVGGVPASIFELARALAITQDTNVSMSLIGLLQARLDTLEPRTRKLLATAAMVGERSWDGLLRALHGDAVGDLGHLHCSDVLVRQPSSTMPGEVEYRFHSELLRRAVLQMIPFAERPALHLRIATWLEQHAPLSFAELVAEHFDRGGAPDASYAHFLAAADEAELGADHAAADRLYRRIAQLRVGPDLLAQAALAYAQAAIHRRDRELAEAQLAEAVQAIERCDAGGETCEHFKAAYEQLLHEASRLQSVAVPAAGG